MGVVGVGGLGSPIAEQIVRMGATDLLLVDDDALDTESNVRRVFGARVKDLREASPRPKVEVVARHLRDIGLRTAIHTVTEDVRREGAFRRLLDCDVVFSATDNHASRATVNELAASYLLPVIDVGVQVGARASDVLCGLIAEVRVLTPTTPCLWCRGTIRADTIRVENLPREERELMRREGYVTGGVGEPVPSVVALTVMASGLATCALLALLSEDATAAPAGYWVDGFFGDSRYTKPAHSLVDCRCRSQLGLGDSSPPPFI